MGPVEVKILLSLGGWLSHGQSCHISFFYITRISLQPDTVSAVIRCMSTFNSCVPVHVIFGHGLCTTVI